MFGGLFQNGNGGGLYKVYPVCQGFTDEGGKPFFGVLVCGHGHGVPVCVERDTGCTVCGCPCVVQCAAVLRYAPLDRKQGGVVAVVADCVTGCGGLALRVKALIQDRISDCRCKVIQRGGVVVAACVCLFKLPLDCVKVLAGFGCGCVHFCTVLFCRFGLGCVRCPLCGVVCGVAAQPVRQG